MSATVGVLLHVDDGAGDALRTRLRLIDGAATFELAEPGRLGVLLVVDELDTARRIIEERIATDPEVLAARPVYGEQGEPEVAV